MKTILFVAMMCLLVSPGFTQTNTPPKRTTSHTPAKARKAGRPAQNSQPISAAIDSFKRSNRYTPGRPYEPLENQSTADTKSNSQASTAGNNQNTTPGNTTVRNSNALGSTPSVNVQSRSINSSASPSNEPNRADINQRPINENSKNAISDAGSSQVNNLNQNQMAPPPQNFGNASQGQNTWGRNTIGEAQWSPTSNVTAGFSRDYPGINGAEWRRDIRDSLNYAARFRSGNNWSVTTYDPSGVRIETRINYTMPDMPRPVTLYKDKLGKSLTDIRQVTRIERPSLPAMYEVQLNSGRVLYLNEQGMLSEYK